MAMSLNKVQLIGNVTRDPESRDAGGSTVVSFGIATNLSWTDGQGNKQTKAEFHNIVAWRKLAEICSTYLRKGSKVYIEGRLQTREWDGPDGVKRNRTEVVAENMIMLDRKGATTESAGEYAGASSDSEPESGSKIMNTSRVHKKVETTESSAAPVEEEISIEDLPF